MKTTLHYIIAILLLSLNAAYVFAEEDTGPFKIINKGSYVNCAYDDVNNLLTISGEGTLTITGDGTSVVEAGIVITDKVKVTIKDLHIRANTPLVFADNGQSQYFFICQGTNILESTGANEPGMNLNQNQVMIKGNSSLKVIGGSNAAGIQGNKLALIGESNNCTFIVAIGGKGASSDINVPDLQFDSGLLISGKQQDDGSIKHVRFNMFPNFILGVDAEIPSWAEVTIGDRHSLTVPKDITLINSGTITNNYTITNHGRLLNHGTLTGNAVVGNAPEHLITFNANYSTSPAVEERYIPQDEALPTDVFSRADYTFVGWFDVADGGTAVTASTEPQTLYARWKADEKPVEPDPPYVPIYYNVYLPPVEGATLDPGPGEYEVESWNTFRFYLTLDSAYSQSQPIVTTDRGETLQPRTSDGAYLVKYVRSDVEVFIDGIVQNPPPVANEAIAPADALAPQIWAEGTMLCIRMAEALPATPIAIYTIDGRQHDSFVSTPGLNRRQLPTGMYIVRVGDTVRKIIVK